MKAPCLAMWVLFVAATAAVATTFTQGHNLNGNVITNASVVTVNERLGVGVAVPHVAIEANGHAKFGNTPPNVPLNYTSSVVLIMHTTTNYVYSGAPFADQSDFGLAHQLNVDPAATPQGYKLYHAGFGVVSTMGTCDYFRAVAYQGQAEHEGSGTIREMRGLAGIVDNDGTGAVVNAIAGRFNVIQGWNTGLGGVINNAYGVLVEEGNAKGAMVRRAGLAVAAPMSGTNHTYLLLGTRTIPEGNYGLYVAASVSNHVNGTLGIGVTAPSAKLDVQGATGYNQLRLRSAYTPTGTADANGSVGDVAWSEDYVYVKTVAGWKRAALTTW